VERLSVNTSAHLGLIFKKYNFDNFSQETKTRCSAVAERSRCGVHYSFGQKWNSGTEDNILRLL